MAGIATSGITYYELYGSGSGQISQDGSVTREFQVAWTDRVAFIRALVGGFFKLSNTNFYYTYPDRHPDWTAFYSQEASYEGIGVHSIGADGQIAYEWAKVTAIYSGLKFDANVTINNIFEEELDWSAEVLAVPGGVVEISPGNPDAGKTIQDPTQLIIPTIDYTLTIEGAPELPGGDATIIANLMASPLNSSSFLGAGPKKVMFKGARASRTTTNQGAKNWKIIYRFCHRPMAEWTKVWNKNGWVEVRTVGSHEPLYNTSDLTQLLPR